LSKSRSVAVCLASYNRKDKTLSCLRALYAETWPADVTFTVYLLEDASTDGTGAAVKSEFPQVRFIEGDGQQFWSGGMRRALRLAMADGHDFYLWLNDDVQIYPGAYGRLIATYDALKAADGREHIVSGPMIDEETGRTSYGGFHLGNKLLPSSARLVEPDPVKPIAVDMVNGNLLLVPRAVAEVLGPISDVFVQTMGDWDYGMRGLKAGFGLWIAPGHYGHCTANVGARPHWSGAHRSLRDRYRMIHHPRSMPFKTRAVFLMRHFPLLSPWLLISPYVTMPLYHLKAKRRAGAAAKSGS